MTKTKVSTEQTIQTLAGEVVKLLDEKTRSNGDTFLAMKDSAPEWVRDLVHEAHGDLLPDDHIYKFVFEALNALADNDDTDDAMESIAADIYTHDLISWLGSNLSRQSYVNEAVENYGIDAKNFEISNILQMGQQDEKIEVFNIVLEKLQERLDETAAV